MSLRRQHAAHPSAGTGLEPPPTPKACAGGGGPAVRIFRYAWADPLPGYRRPAGIVKCRHRLPAVIAGVLIAAGAGATDVTVAGLFPNKAVVQIDGGSLQTLSVGQKSAEGVLLVAVDGDGATFDIQGKRVTLGMGHARMPAGSSPAASAVLYPDTSGHYISDGQVNGMTIRFLVDTGATHVTLPAREARRLGLDYRKGRRGMTNTANGNAPVYLIKLESVSLGNITVYGVDAVVMESENLSQPLLGMTFLNRMDMKRAGDIMTLTQRY